MSAEYICDGCGERAPAVRGGNDWSKPWKWFQRGDSDGIQDACSRECIATIAAKTGKTAVVIPL